MSLPLPDGNGSGSGDSVGGPFKGKHAGEKKFSKGWNRVRDASFVQNGGEQLPVYLFLLVFGSPMTCGGSGASRRRPGRGGGAAEQPLRRAPVPHSLCRRALAKLPRV